MSHLDPTALFLELDVASAMGLFWYVIVIDLPRYTLGFFAVAASRLFREGSGEPDPSFGPLVTIVLAGHNERGTVRRCVQSLRQQTHDRLEIICVDDGSIDGMRFELRQMRQERLIDVALSTSLRSGKSSAGNLGISCAHGEIIVMADCDCTFDRDAIRHLIAPFNDPAIGAVSGNVGVRNDRATLLSAMQGMEYLLTISMGKRLLDLFEQVACASGAFSAFRRRALAEVAGHDVGPGEDLDLTLRLRRAGWKVRFAEKAWCLTDVPETLGRFVNQRLRWERDSLRLRMRKHRRGIYRRDGWESGHELLHHIEFVLFHLVATFAFYAYLIWLSYAFGAAALTVLVMAAMVYILLDLIAVGCVLVTVDRAEVSRLLPLRVPLRVFPCLPDPGGAPHRVHPGVGVRVLTPRRLCPHARGKPDAVLLIRRLQTRGRVDRLANQIRDRRPRFGRYLYLALLFVFFLWIADLFFGPLLRLEADGLVIAEYTSVGVPFAAQVDEVKVRPGAQVKRGDMLARVSSIDLSVDIATLTARNAELLTQRADIQDRLRVASAVLPIARDRATEADRALERIRNVRDSGNVSLATWSQALSERFTASERVAALQAEAFSADASLAAVNAALADATRALAQLSSAYGSGRVTAPEDGIVGLSTARPGDVVTIGQPLMLLYLPQRYVLAYLETGTLYTIAAGDQVQITDGFVRSSGHVTEVLPVAEQLPDEFRKVFQPRGRGQVARISLPPETTFPLFAKVRLSGIGWLSSGTFVRSQLDRLLRPILSRVETETNG